MCSGSKLSHYCDLTQKSERKRGREGIKEYLFICVDFQKTKGRGNETGGKVPH